MRRTEARIRKYFELGRDAGPPGFAPPPEAAFDAAFPGLARSQTACERPRLRVVAFPNAGSAEDMYTSEGTGVRRASSPLLDWCRANGAEVLAVQLPGRALRSKEPYTRSAQEVAAALVPLLGSRLADTPYVLVGHSLGSWLAYEFAAACRDAGLPPPRQAFLSALAAPDIPFDRRPWRQQAGLDEEDFKDECRGWSVAELVFDKAMWPVYHPLLRADFRLFDEYKHRRTGEPPFDFPIHTFWGVDDARIPKDLVEVRGGVWPCGGGGL